MAGYRVVMVIVRKAGWRVRARGRLTTGGTDWSEAAQGDGLHDLAVLTPGSGHPPAEHRSRDTRLVSDSYIRLIPASPDRQPRPGAADAAVAYVASLFSGPDDAVEKMEHTFCDRTTLIEAGENTSQTVSRHSGAR